MAETMHCGHESRTAVLCCTHLAQKTVGKLYWVPADPENPKTAWCAVCERARVADRGWHDAADAVAQWCWVCHGCFEARARAAFKRVELPGIATED